MKRLFAISLFFFFCTFSMQAGTLTVGGSGTLTTGGSGTATLTAAEEEAPVGDSFYIATTGTDSGSCPIGSPCATLAYVHGLAALNGGDTIYYRTGTYNHATTPWLTKAGEPDAYITLRNYPGETVTISGSTNPNTGGHAVIRWEESAKFWHIYGLRILDGGGQGIRIEGASGITVENCYFENNTRLDSSGAALQAGGRSTHLRFINNDLYNNGKIDTGGGDCIGIYTVSTEYANIEVRGNRMWYCNDDGIDLFDSRGHILVENNWVWRSGYETNNVATSGNGVGFKLGGGGVVNDGGHIVRNNVVVDVKAAGFDENSSNVPLELYNNSCYRVNLGASGNNCFNFYSAVANVLRNNLADNPDTVSFHASVDDTFNSWNLAVTVNDSDYQSVDINCLDDSREADGSLPTTCNFLKLVGGSDLINVGTDVGLPYNGAAPDLGAYETTP